VISGSRPIDDLAERDLSDYLEVSLKETSARFLRGPKLADVPYPVQMEPKLVIEFCSC
jgi:small subunit ribosomal protein S4